MHCELVAVGIPGRPPAPSHHLPVVHECLLESGIILCEVVVTGYRRLDETFISHLGTLKTDLRKVLDGPFVFIKETVLTLDQGFTCPGAVGTGQSTFDTVLVIELEDLAELVVRIGIAPAAERVSVE